MGKADRIHVFAQRNIIEENETLLVYYVLFISA